MPQQSVDLIIQPEWLIPVTSPGVLSKHSLIVDEGRIVEYLPTPEATAKYRAQTVEQRPGHALIPGLVNAHTHAAMSLLRGLADDLPLMTWLEQHIWPAEGQWVGPEFCRDGVSLAIAEMLLSGTTCFNDMYFYPEITARIASDCGMRASVGMIVIDFPSAYAQNAQEYLQKGEQVRDDYRNNPLISTVFAPHAPYTVNDENLAKIRMLADEMELPVHMHVHETAGEVAQAVAEQGQRPIERLNKLGLLSPQLIAVHMTELDKEEIALCAQRNIKVVHCPESNMKLASGSCPVQQLLDAGITVALGTDGAASNNDLDLFGEMRSAALLGKITANNAAALNASSVLSMATIHGAEALGIAAETGSISPGKWADLCCVDLNSVATQPVYDPIATLVYAASRHQVRDVWVAGKAQVRNGQLLNINQSQVLKKAQQWQEKIQATAS